MLRYAMGCGPSIEQARAGCYGNATSTKTIDKSCFLYGNLIGEGGFGKVYSAYLATARNWFAVKEINKYELLKHKTGVDMLINELRAMQRLEHSFIIRLHFAFHDPQSCFLVLDLKTGGDLRHYLRKRTVFDEQDVAFYIACISTALDHIHSKKVIHRDIKPENIILDSHGFPHLTDFGVAHVGCDRNGTLTTSLASGTKQYLAPEVFTKLHIHGAEVDYWGLGVLAYELLFGKRPFEKHCPTSFIQYLENAYVMNQKRQLRAERTKKSAKTTASAASGACASHSGDYYAAGSSPSKQSSRNASPCPLAISPSFNDGYASAGTSPARSSRDVHLNCHSFSNRVSDKQQGASGFSLLALPVGRNSEDGGSTCKDSLSDSEDFSHDDVSVCRVSNIGSSVSSAGSLMCPSPVRIGHHHHHQQGHGHGCSTDGERSPNPHSSFVGCAMEERKLLFPLQQQRDSASASPAMFEDTDDESVPELFEDHWAVTQGDLPVTMRVPIPGGNSWLGELSPECISMLEGLFEVRPSHRFGCRNLTVLQMHPYLQRYGFHNWVDLQQRQIRPSFVPGRRASILCRDSEEGHHTEHKLCGLNDTAEDQHNVSTQDQLRFKDFHFVCKSYLDDYGGGSDESTDSSAPSAADQEPMVITCKKPSLSPLNSSGRSGASVAAAAALESPHGSGGSQSQSQQLQAHSPSRPSPSRSKYLEGRPPINHQRLPKIPLN